MSPIGYTQPESPCGCIDSVVIGVEKESEKLVSNLNFVDNTCYQVHGTLFIDEPT